MATEVKVPTLGESVTTATVARWMKQAGEAVAADEPLVELETDKVTVEVSAPAAGVLTSISAPEGSEVAVGARARRAGSRHRHGDRLPDRAAHCPSGIRRKSARPAFTRRRARAVRLPGLPRRPSRLPNMRRCPLLRS